MPLISFGDTRPWAKSIATRVANGTMPPWHADPAVGHFLNDRRLSDADRDTIVKWAGAGAPEGNRADLPAPPTFADGWQMGQPDTVWSMQEDYPIPASGTIEYKNFEVPTNLTEDRWAQAIEIRPGNRSVVHHVIVYLIDPNARPHAAALHPRRQHAPSGGGAQDRARRRAERSADEAWADRLARGLCAGAVGPRLRAGHGAARAGRRDARSSRSTTRRPARRRRIGRASASSGRRKRRRPRSTSPRSRT